MILYNSNYFGLLQLTTFSGSAVYRTILPSVVSTCVFFVYKFIFGHGHSAQEIRENIDEAIYTVHPFVITIYIMAVSLIINHRLNYCYQRYWESCSSIFMMTSKWIDSATTLAAFHYQSIVYDEDRPQSFGDEDKSLDQLKDKDKNKLAPTGGNTRTAMVNFGGLCPEYDYMDNYEPNDDDIDRDGGNGTTSNNSATSASDSSDSASSAIHEHSSYSASAAPESSISKSGRSLISVGSRERHRQYSEVDNLSRAKRRFSSVSFSTENSDSEARTKALSSSLRQMLTWKSTSKRKYQRTRHISALNEVQSSPRKNSIRESDDGSSIFDTDFIGNKLKRNYSSTPPRDNLSTSKTGASRRGLFRKIPSMPIPQSQTRRDTRKGHGTNMAYGDRSAGKHPTEGTPAGEQSHHRRLPSTDIPTPGIGGSVVKSFKPNPSLDWQKRNRTAMPRNTGLHSTVFQTPIGFDFDKLLLKEEEERQKEARKKQFEDWKQRQQELQQEKQTGIAGQGFLGAASRRTSLPLPLSFRLPIVRSNSNTNSVISVGNPARATSDPTRSSVSSLKKSIDDDDKIGNSQKSNKLGDSFRLPNLFSRLELSDLPSLHKKHTADNSDSIFPSGPSVKKVKSEIGTGSVPFSDYADDKDHHNNNTIGINSSKRQSSLLRPPVEKMNGRASLFLQEAAHLYSLMSAVAMASLRADMEGVSSPLVDYVPGHEFPPVNPEEMQIKILVTKEKVELDAKISPSDDDDVCKIETQNDITESELRVQIKLNSKYSNILMFLFGMSRNSRQRTIYNASRPFTVLGGISDAEVEMLRKVRGHSAQHALCCLWLREFITREHLHGSTGSVAPAIVARVYQHISDGTQQYNNCRKTAFTAFPFPHAQMTSFFAFVSIFIFPLLYYTYVNNTYIAVILNFFTLSCFFGIQEVALELEEPFIRYPNDLPLNNYQAQFNEALISSLYGGFHPDAWGDTADNEGIFSTCYEDGGDDSSNDREIRISTLSKMSSSDLSGGKNSIPIDGQDGIEDSSAGAGSRNTRASTDGEGRISNDSSNSISKTKMSTRHNQNTMVHFRIPEGHSL